MNEAISCLPSAQRTAQSDRHGLITTTSLLLADVGQSGCWNVAHMRGRLHSLDTPVTLKVRGPRSHSQWTPFLCHALLSIVVRKHHADSHRAGSTVMSRFRSKTSDKMSGAQPQLTMLCTPIGMKIDSLVYSVACSYGAMG